MTRPNIVPVILCGGSGTRLWPASREKHPKQFLPLMNDLSLLQNTMRRALSVSGAPASNLVIVTLAAMKDGVEKQLSELDAAATAHIVCEPSARNTGASVALAATYVKNTFGEDALLWILPADHHITREDILAQAFDKALDAANDGNLVTFGISPSRPDTGYGYIRVGAAANGYNMAERFVENPDITTAQSYLDDGNYLWNSGMFLFSAREVLSHYTTLAGDILSVSIDSMDKGTAKNPCGETFAGARKQPFDKAIMEKSAKVAVVPCDPEWSDVGSWESLWDLRAKDANNNAIDGRAACFNAKGCLIQGGQDRLIAVAGLDNIVVVETDDAILITNKSDGDSMKALVTGLKESGAREVFEHAPKEIVQPWTMVKSLPDKSLQAREIVIQPGQSKNFPAQSSGLCLYTVLEGAANIAIGGTMRTLRAFESADIQASADYTITNKGDAALKMIEVQKDAAEGIVFRKQPATGTIKKVA